MAKEINKLDAKTIKNLSYDPNINNKYTDGGGLYLLVHKNGSKILAAILIASYQPKAQYIGFKCGRRIALKSSSKT